MAWLEEHVERWGFKLRSNAIGAPDARIKSRERLEFSKNELSGDAVKRRVVLNVATFEGAVRIIDAEVAQRSLLLGVGHGRAYGCGLLTLAPLKR